VIDSLDNVGVIYRVKFRAKNVDGQYSEFSDELIFAFGPLPSTPTAPVKDSYESNRTAIALTWTKITGDTLPILGYKLYADNGYNDDFKLIFDGSNMPEINNFIYQSNSLNPFLKYRFYVTAINFNGESGPSPIAELRPCTDPSDLDKPYITSITQTLITISWTQPKSDGGCTI